MINVEIVENAIFFTLINCIKVCCVKPYALIIFAKEPVAGKVKTRLVPFLTESAAADLYRCMLIDTLAKARKLAEVNIFLFHTGDATGASYFRELAANVELFEQQGAGLGERMNAAFKHVFELGYGRVAIIGTDSPHLPLSFIEEAYRLLEYEEVDAVYGPSLDGGYYLLALRHLHGELFQGIEWSSQSVLQDSLKKARGKGLEVALLPLWRDVDRTDDLFQPELMLHENGADLTREYLATVLAALP